MALENRTTAAVVAGYLLGRTEDFDLAARAGDLVSRLNVSASPSGLAEGLQEFVEASKELSELSGDAIDQLFEAVKNEDVQAIADRFEAEGYQDEDVQSEEEDDEEEAGEEEPADEDPDEEEAGEEEPADEETDEEDDEGEEEPADEDSDEEEDEGEEETPGRKKSG